MLRTVGPFADYAFAARPCLIVEVVKMAEAEIENSLDMFVTPKVPKEVIKKQLKISSQWASRDISNGR